MEYDYEESTQLIKSLWRFARPKEVQRLKERRAYAKDCKRIKDKVREKREERGENITLRGLARRCVINENTFLSALSPSAIMYGNQSEEVLFSALSELRMFPTPPLREKFENSRFRTYGNFAV